MAINKTVSFFQGGYQHILPSLLRLQTESKSNHAHITSGTTVVVCTIIQLSAECHWSYIWSLLYDFRFDKLTARSCPPYAATFSVLTASNRYIHCSTSRGIKKK